MSATMKWQTPEDFVKRRMSRTSKSEKSPEDIGQSPLQSPSQTISQPNRNNNNNNQDYKNLSETNSINGNNQMIFQSAQTWIQNTKHAAMQMIQNTDWLDNHISSIAKYIWSAIGLMIIVIILARVFSSNDTVPSERSNPHYAHVTDTPPDPSPKYSRYYGTNAGPVASKSAPAATLSAADYAPKLVSEHLSNLETYLGPDSRYQPTSLQSEYNVRSQSYFATMSGQNASLGSAGTSGTSGSAAGSVEVGEILGVLGKLGLLKEKLDVELSYESKLQTELASIYEIYNSEFYRFANANETYHVIMMNVAEGPTRVKEMEDLLDGMQRDQEGLKLNISATAGLVKDNNGLLTRLQAELKEDVTKGLKGKEESLKTQENFVETYKKEIAVVQDEIEKHKGRVGSESKRLEELNALERDCQTQVRQLGGKIAESGHIINQYQSKIDIRQSALDILTKEMTHATQMGAGNKILSLQDIIDAKQRDIDGMKSALLQYKRDSERQDAEDISGDRRQLEARSETDGSNGEDEDNTMQDVMSIVKWARNEEIRKREKEIDTAESAMMFYKELLQKGTKTQSLEKDIARFQYILNEKEKELKELKNVMEDYEKQLSGYQREIGAIAKFLAQADGMETEMKSNLAANKNKLTECENEIKLIQEQIEALKKKKMELTNRIDDVENDIVAGQNKRDHLVRKLEDVELNIDAQKVQILDLMRDQEESFFDVETAYDIVTKHMRALKEYEIEIFDYIKKIDTVSGKVQQIAVEMAQYLNISNKRNKSTLSNYSRASANKQDTNRECGTNDGADGLQTTSQCGVTSDFALK